MCEEKYVPNFVLMEKKETRLVFVDDPKQRKQEVLGEIFRISKWDENNTVAILNEMKNLEFVSGKGSAGSDVFFKLLYMMIKKDGGKSTESEYRLRTLIEQYIEKEVMDSYGMYIPTFVNELKKMGNKDTNHKALLIGVMSAQSHQEFSACVAKVFPNNMANSIDIDPNDELKKCSNFCEMDVFNMTGIENNSIDSIHMHIFLSDFVNGDEETLWKIVY